jgi:hypothetical protein
VATAAGPSVRLQLAPFEKLTLADALGLAPAALRVAQKLEEPVLATTLVSGGGLVLGSLQRREAFEGDALVRYTTGPCAMVAGLAFHHVFALPWLSSVAPDANRRNLLNRYVRGFLRGYSRLGVQAQYVGREFISLGRRPCGVLGYEVTADGALVVEALVGLDAAVLTPSGETEPAASLFELVRARDPADLVPSIHQGFAAKWQLEPTQHGLFPEALPPRRESSGDFVRRRVPVGWLEAAASLGETATVRLTGDVLSSHAVVEAVESRATAALLAGRTIDGSVIAPLVEGPLDGALPEDARLVLDEACRRAAERG